MVTEKHRELARIPFDSLTLRAVAAELHDALIGGRVQDVRQPDSCELRITIRNRGKNVVLALSCSARFARLHLTTERAKNAPSPPTFCMALRKHICGGIIRDVRQIGFDRICEIDVEAGDSAEPSAYATVIAELMGKHSNIVLVSGERTIIDSAKRVSRRINRFRETLPGLPYSPPPAQFDKSDPFALPWSPAITPGARRPEIEAAIVREFWGISAFLAREILARAAELDPTDPVKALATASAAIFAPTARGEYAPVLLRDAAGDPIGAYPFPIAQAAPESQTPIATLNEALDAAYRHVTVHEETEDSRAALQARIRRAKATLAHRMEGAEAALTDAERAESYRRAGELILANAARIAPGDSSVEIEDYYDEELPKRIIVLNPAMSPQENAAACFRRYRKAQDAREHAQQRADEAARAIHKLEDAEATLGGLNAEDEIRALHAALAADGALAAEQDQSGPEERKGADEFEGYRIRRTTTPEGYDILYGENALANDYLTTRVAGPNDIWLHVRADVSAHVVVRTHGKPEAVPRTVLDRAAEICARHSAQKHSSLVPVDYTLKRYVRKPRRAAPGSVDYEREKTLHIVNPQND